MGVPTYSTKVEVYAGDGWSWTFRSTVPTDPAEPDGTREPENLTAWGTWECQWRTSDTAATFIALTVDSTLKATGVITVSATPTQTRDMAADGEFDVQAVSGGIPRTFVRARTKWRRDVTRP